MRSLVFVLFNAVIERILKNCIFSISFLKLIAKNSTFDRSGVERVRYLPVAISIHLENHILSFYKRSLIKI